MELPIELSKNLHVYQMDTLDMNEDDSVIKIRFHCIFHTLEYVADVSKQNVDNDWPSIEAEGESELFDSFIDQMENHFWDKLKELFKIHESDHNREYTLTHHDFNEE